MPLPPVPVDRILTPDPDRLPPDGFTLVDLSVSSGLPQRMPLFAAVEVVLLVPTGLALAWRQADPGAEFSSDDPQWLPHAPSPTAPTAGAPARLMITDQGDVLGSVPLVAGNVSRVPQDGDPAHGAVLDLLVLGWRLRAGSMVGVGDAGSRLRIAWRRIGQAASTFSPPAAAPRILVRRGDVGKDSMR